MFCQSDTDSYAALLDGRLLRSHVSDSCILHLTIQPVVSCMIFLLNISSLSSRLQKRCKAWISRLQKPPAANTWRMRTTNIRCPFCSGERAPMLTELSYSWATWAGCPHITWFMW
ncbi:hypothetical protein VFPPC_08031 [Pochonia chlamydosporia 170]|uniref:Uncharacterized protein n=1 Tax=Pochonia chlamydosporia 170 TaxID=1380566 RepID=A0A179FLQ1_METCM|nr:hypothetical protein VFPPC_08031 [Pochonia chlamydosporia 170]OAQ66484.1 hypothetical protein VFPPC_08031 [Pochonia chlamydosporia 170]